MNTSNHDDIMNAELHEEQPTPTTHPGILLHTAISKNNFPKCQTLLATHGSYVGTYKNARGSTPLMLAAEGKPSKRTSLQLIDLLLQPGMGGRESAAERSLKGRTAADILSARALSSGEARLVELASRLRSYEQTAAQSEEFDRCPIPYCKAKLPSRGRTKLHFVADEVRKGSESNPLLVDMCAVCTTTSGSNETRGETTSLPAVVEMLGGALYHKVNSCVAFRKECTESMALIRELRCLRSRNNGALFAGTTSSCTSDLVDTAGSNTTTTSCYDPPSSEKDGDDWSSWHIIDLCAGSCLTGCLALALLPGIKITAVDLRGGGQNHHHGAENDTAEEEAASSNEGGGDDSKVGTSGSDGAAYDVEAHLRAAGVLIPDQFRYVSGDLHDPHLIEVLSGHLSEYHNITPVRVVVLGVHCCGMLSVRAVEIANGLEADALLLMPCCLPAKKTVNDDNNNVDGNDALLPSMADVYSSSDQNEQYSRWASYLADLARSKGIGMATGGSVHVREVTDVISVRNILVTVEGGTA